MHEHPEHGEHRAIRPDEDPVCGMTVDPAVARERGLVATHADREYVFCGKGCYLEFRDNPDQFLDPRHHPSM